MTVKAINVRDEFTRFPAGRYISDGSYSGERFRIQFLIPALNSADLVEIHLDGTLSPGSSFLEEAFGGLLRHGFTTSDLASRLKIVSSDEVLVAEVRQYLGISVH
jgi:STAS-like domain of unknown function (DUF4325)